MATRRASAAGTGAAGTGAAGTGTAAGDEPALGLRDQRRVAMAWAGAEAELVRLAAQPAPIALHARHLLEVEDVLTALYVAAPYPFGRIERLAERTLALI